MDSEIFDFDIEQNYQDFYGQLLDANTTLKHPAGVISNQQQWDLNDEFKLFNVLDLDEHENKLKDFNQIEEDIVWDIDSFVDNSTAHQINAEELAKPLQHQRDDRGSKSSDPIQIAKNHIFNNFPGFKLGAIQSLAKNMKLNEEQIEDLSKISLILQIFDELKTVLMMLSTKDGKRTQLRMVFNEIDYRIIQDLERKTKKCKAEQKYLQLIKKFKDDKKLINEAKHHLRCAVANLMTTEWIHEHIQKRKFKTQSNLKKEIFEKYLNYFKLELIQGEIRVAIQRSTILEMPPFSELKSGPELYQ